MYFVDKNMGKILKKTEFMYIKQVIYDFVTV